MNEDTTDWQKLKHIAEKNFSRKREKRMPGSNRCVVCGIQITQAWYQLVCTWAERRNGKHPVICWKCANRIWPLLQGSTVGGES